MPSRIRIRVCRRGPPFELGSSMEPFAQTFPELNVAFRFGVEQGAELRARGELRYSMTNIDCVVRTPVKLVSWDHLAVISRLAVSGCRDWRFFKANREAAYKQLPMGGDHAALAAISLRLPTKNARYGFLGGTLMFGAVSAVLRYNLFARLLCELFSQRFGGPINSYLYDFGALVPADMTTETRRTFTHFCAAPGFPIKLKKSDVGLRATFWRLAGSPPVLTETGIYAFLRHLGNPMIGIPPFALLSRRGDLFRRPGRSRWEIRLLPIGPFRESPPYPAANLIQKLYAVEYYAKLCARESRALFRRCSILCALHRRIPRVPNCRPDLIIYSDAATSTNRIAALCMRTGSGPPVIS